MIKRLLTHEIFIVTTLVIIALALNALPWIFQITHIPPGLEFIPVHNSFSDYSFYTSVITQGLNGERLVFDRFTVLPHQGSIIQILYLVIGWIGKAVGITSANVAYHASRYILGTIWCIVLYQLTKMLIKEKWIRIAAFFFILFSSSFPIITAVNGHFVVSSHMDWWSELDPIIRSAFVPHFLAGHILMVLAIISLFRFASTTRSRWLSLGAISGFLAAIIHPPSAIILFCIFPLYALLVRKKNVILGSLTILIASGIGLFMINDLSNYFPWNLAKAYEGISFPISLTDYLLALGPIVILACIGAINRIKQKDTWLLSLWVVMSISMIYIDNFLPSISILSMHLPAIANVRFLQVAVWVPLGILGAYGLAAIWKYFGKPIGISLLFLFIVLTLIGYPQSLQTQINSPRSESVWNGNRKYAPKGYTESIKAISSITPSNKSVLSLFLGGMTIPMYTDRSVFLGQPVYTPDLRLKQKQAWDFYAGNMQPCDAYTFLKNNNIGTVFYSFDEQNAGSAVASYSFLQPHNIGNSILYTVTNDSTNICAQK